LATWPEEDQKLFESSFESLEGSLQAQRQWIRLRILGVLPRGTNLFFLPIKNTDYFLICTKREFARLLGKTHRQDLSVYFGIDVKVVPKMLLLALSKYHWNHRAPTGNGRKIEDWPAVASSSRLLANSSIEYLESVYTNDGIHGFVFMTGNDRYERGRRFLGGGRTVPIGSESLSVSRMLAELYSLVRDFKMHWEDFPGIFLIEGITSSSFEQSVAEWFKRANQQAIGEKFIAKNKDAIEELDERLKSYFRSMFDVEEPTENDDTPIEIHASLLCSRSNSKQQASHADYTHDAVGKRVIGLLPLGPFGGALQVWTKPLEEVEQGTLISIPQHMLALFPDNCIHGGGFKIGSDADVNSGDLRCNFRIHFYFQQGVKNGKKVRVNTWDFLPSKPSPRNSRPFTRQSPDQSKRGAKNKKIEGTWIPNLKTDSPHIGALSKNVFTFGHNYKEPS
jgi:hypothetical protein